MSELYHWGIKGQKWGVRNYQNADGSLTSAGRLRYGVGSAVRGGVFNSSNTAYSKAKKLAKFGSALGKAKAEHYGKQAKKAYGILTSPGGYSSYKRNRNKRAELAKLRMNSRNIHAYTQKRLKESVNIGRQRVYRTNKEIIQRRISTFGSYKTDDEVFAIGMAACKALEEVSGLMAWRKR